jgi:hypothetical protein
MEEDLRTHLGTTLERNGLQLVELRRVSFSAEEYDKLRERRGQTAMAAEKLADTEDRATLNQRLRQVLTKDKMDRFATKKEFEEFVRQTEHELGMKEVIRRSEMDELVRTYNEKKEDSEIARRHLLEMLDLQHRMEVIQHEHAIDDQQLEHRLKQERQQLETRQEAEWREALQRKKVRGVEREDEMADAEADLDIKRKKIQLGMQAREQKIDLAHKEASQQVALDQEAKDREAARELERERELSRQEQERLAADLKKTELMKDMTEDQIMAMMAKDAPHVAEAIAERYKAQAQTGASAEITGLYEKLIAAKESEADRMERVMGRALESVERAGGSAADREREQREETRQMAGESMDRMADVAAAKAGVSTGADSQGAAVVCSHCHQHVPAGSKFCDNCGHRFFE